MSDLQRDQAPTNGAPNGAAATEQQALWHATPELDVYESSDALLVLLNVPGASPESIDIQVMGNELYVSAKQAASPRYADVALATFERRLELPSAVDGSSASAKLRDGVLEIQIQKSAAARRVKIPVNAN